MSNNKGLDRTNAAGEGLCMFPSGNVAAMVVKTPSGTLITFFSDSATNAQVRGSFDHQGIGGVTHLNGKPWLVVTKQGWSVSDKFGAMIERGKFPRAKMLEPLTFKVFEQLVVTFVDRQNIVAKLQCGDVMKEWQCGEQLRRSESHLSLVVGTTRGKLELDVAAIRLRHQEQGNVYVSPGPHQTVTELPGIGGARVTLRSMPAGSALGAAVAGLHDSDARVLQIDTLPRPLYGGMKPKQVLLDFGEAELSTAQRKFKETMRTHDYSKATFKGSRLKLQPMSVSEVEAKISGPGFAPDTLSVLCVLADWNPVCRKVEPHLQTTNHRLEQERLASPASPSGHIKMYKVDASESGVLQQQYGFRTVPMFLMFYEGKLVEASNALYSSSETYTAALGALSKGRKHQYLPEGFSLSTKNIGNSSLDYIRPDMRLAS